MKNLNHGGQDHRTLGLLAFVTISVFCIVFFADRGRFELNLTTPAVMAALTPFQRAAAWIGSKTDAVIKDIQEIINVREQNAMLRQEVQILREQNRKAVEMSAENVRLRALLNYKNVATQFDFVMAKIIGREPSTWTNVVTIDRGTGDGLKKNMPVVTTHGLIGRVIAVSPLSSHVELLTDARAAVSTIDQRSRVAGIVKGDINDQFHPHMVNIPRSADVIVGDVIVTSGFGGIYPKGLVVGKVTEIKNDAGGLLKYAVLEAAADLQKLEDVAVIATSREAPPAPIIAPPVTPGTENPTHPTHPAQPAPAQPAAPPAPAAAPAQKVQPPPANATQPAASDAKPAATEKKP